MEGGAHCTNDGSVAALRKCKRNDEKSGTKKGLMRHSTSPTSVCLEQMATAKGNEERENGQVGTMRRA